MQIAGFTKVSLLDYPEKVSAIIFTKGCNFACDYCHNSSIAMGKCDTVSANDILAYLSKRRGLLDAVVITGGEPLIWEDLLDLVSKIKDMGYLVKLDTNGYLPDRLQKVLQSGLIDYVAMDIKGTGSEYTQIARIPNFDFSCILNSIEIIEKSGVDHEYRTTFIRDYNHDIEGLIEVIPDKAKYYIQSFEDSEDVPCHTLSKFSDDEIHSILDKFKRSGKNAHIR